MDQLKRELAPVSELAWREIESEVRRAFTSNLTARRLVGFSGPHGADFSAVSLGRLSTPTERVAGVEFGVRRVQPLIEARAPFELSIGELDNLSRGATQVDLSAAASAALDLASFEERVVYRGLTRAGMIGLAATTDNPPVPLGAEPAEYLDAVARAMLLLADRGVTGPYALVLGPEPFQRLSADVSTYPPRQRIEALLQGPILHSRALEGGVLLSVRGGDFEMAVGQDASLGYQHHGPSTVQLYLTETFTFRIHAPEAAVAMPSGDPDVTLVEAAAALERPGEAAPRGLSTDLEVKVEA